MNSKRILKNTVWYGLENLISIASSFVTSIAIARVLGPAQMGYIIYVVWIAGIASTLGSIGIPVTTRKYMAEFIGSGDYASARAVYVRTFLIQAIFATVATAASLAWVYHDAPPGFRLASVILVLSIWPAMVNFISAQANVAAERLSANLPASLASTLTFLVMVILTTVRGWGVVGVASAMFAMRFVDFAVRLLPTASRVLRWNADGQKVPTDLYARMSSFALQSLTSMALTIIVWDRSELFLLKHLSGDIRQIAYYSVAFNLAERLLIFPNIFAGATGASMFVQQGRDRAKVPGMAAAAIRYLALSSIPLYAIAVPLAGPAILTLYGPKYAGAILTATIAPLLCLPKAFLTPIQNLFESTEQQKYFIWATVLASLIDIGLAWKLIPGYGAVGACLASGIAQTFAIVVLWAVGIHKYGIVAPWGFLQKVIALSIVAACIAYGIIHRMPSLLGLLSAGLAAVTVTLILVRALRVLEDQDWNRLTHVLTSCPRFLLPPLRSTLSLLGRPKSEDLMAPPAV